MSLDITTQNEAWAATTLNLLGGRTKESKSQQSNYKHNAEAQKLTKYIFPKPESHHNKEI